MLKNTVAIDKCIIPSSILYALERVALVSGIDVVLEVTDEKSASKLNCQAEGITTGVVTGGGVTVIVLAGVISTDTAVCAGIV